jgi:hypothetical protein
VAPRLLVPKPRPKSLLNFKLLNQARFGGLFCAVFNGVSVNNFTMFTTDSLEIKVRLILLELLMVLHRNGIKEVSCGALMRVLGVPAEETAKYDDEDIVIDHEIIEELVRVRGQFSYSSMLDDSTPPGTTIH